eukprot:1958596-Prorocentrum_lima.AAC.1
MEAIFFFMASIWVFRVLFFLTLLTFSIICCRSLELSIALSRVSSPSNTPARSSTCTLRPFWRSLGSVERG